jgi:serine-type D-Ala-D-Ala carboxypeptidase/endopeptidase (penicillin-binding protein 4)
MMIINALTHRSLISKVAKGLPIVIFQFVMCISMSAQTSYQALQSTIDQLLSDPFYRRSHLGFAVRDLATNELLLGQNTDKLFIPASTIKLITNFAAREMLGANYIFETRITHDGSIDQGVLRGNIYIEGSGDPTLGSLHSSSNLSMAAIVASINYQIKQLGITQIDGQIIADESVFSSFPISPSWQWNDIGSYFATGAWGINILDNSYSIYFHRDGAVGTSTAIAYWEPYVPNLKIVNEVQIDQPSTEDKSVILGGPYVYDKKVVGNIPQGKTPYRVKAALPDPPLFMAYQVYQSLALSGLTSAGYKTQQFSDYRKGQRQLITSFKSPSLDQIIRLANEKSINLYSEAILKTVGLRRRGTGSEANGISETKQYVSSLGLDISALHMEDGSGLSTRNLVSPSLMSEFLRQIAQREPIEQIIGLMPIAGESGTVRNLLSDSPAKGRFWVKSGSMDRILCYAGYCKSQSGRMLSFSIMLNAASGKSTRENRKQIEKILEAVYLNL